MQFGTYTRILRKYGARSLLRVISSHLRRKDLHFQYKGAEIILNHEAAAIYHMLNSVEKLENLVMAIPEANLEVILDIGANCGLFSLFANMRFPTAKIYAFEPSPQLQTVLTQNIGSRGVEIIKKAVAEKDGIQTLFVNRRSQQTNSLIRDSVTPFADVVEHVEVEAVCLDTFLEQTGINSIDIMKVDVQGAESRVLRGGRRVLDKTKYLILEATFLDRDVFEVIELARQVFPYHRTINPVLFGADILFSKHPLRQ